ncbi:MAG TPA: Mut7-C RNAse domain-containing protein [Syntrophales bacterium]|nr:Mut7-C RNAse domain-containing protein [Syntrophales bacterium]
MKFLTDLSLGKLTKWLRILGYDTFFYRGNIDLDCLRKAEKEQRVVLTRQKALRRRQYSGRLLVVNHDELEKQIDEVTEKLSLPYLPDRLFTRCVKCNVELLAASKDDVAGYVPAYALENYSSFRRCSCCETVFWPGTHRDNMLKFIQSRNPSHRL